MAKRLTGIDVMQGIAMVLVVLGHHRFDFMPEWYMRMFYWIYTFHMPLFIFISGFLVRYSYKGVHGWSEYSRYVGKRVRKFVPPYLIVGTICTLMAWNFKDVGALLTSWANLIISPKESEVTFLWYIYLLFFFYCMAPLIFNAKRWVRGVLLIVALILSLHYIPIPYFCIDWFTRYFLFFLLGALVAEHYTQVERVDARWSLLGLVAFVIMSIAHFRGGYNAALEYAMQWVGIPAFAGVAWLLMHWAAARKAMVYVSVNCFGVYLLHMFFVQAGAIVVARLPWAIPSWGYIIYLLVSATVSIGATAWIWSVVQRKSLSTASKAKSKLNQ